MKRKQSTNQEPSASQKLDNQTARRRLLKTIAGGGAISSVAALLPTSWVKPVINSVTLPAHAQTSPITPPTTYALVVLSGPAIRRTGTPATNINCGAGPEFDPVTVGVVPADGTKDGLTITMTRTWGTGPGTGKNSTTAAPVTIVGSQVTIAPEGATPGIDACNAGFTNSGDSITLGFTISDSSATPTSAGPFTAD
ncbi:MAG: hypothetical protein ACN4GR_08600 [Arenicellales bacterium]